ncbi:sugar phosphate isomerase/epimerase family protein [Paenibacillus hamazuiensis]|uniref:sugar phosphate isomerase/epimerase family protein n=1 Tax=Paenibacillus hamazuiensis TaxID=2936508 RepID=UPI00200E6E68|nr:sugar phosphate isomerase/epimerase [Paenibacillus hamazuiensis]
MKLKGMGVSLPISDTTSNLEKLKTKLHKIAELGFETVELPVQAMNILKNGMIDRDRLTAYRRLLGGFPLRYTTHAPFDVNLFRQGDASADERCLLASVEISGTIGAEVMVYHVGRFVGEEEFLFPQVWRKHSSEEKAELMLRERQWMIRAGDLGRECGVVIAMENMRPYLDCPDYAYSVIPHVLAEQLEEIGHSHVGAALDTGHLALSVHMYGLDWHDEIEKLAPYVVHLHLHDNFGKACFSTEKSQYDLTPLGRGDMHAPIGEGNLPFELLAAGLRARFHGHVIHEIRDMYEPLWPELRARYEKAFGPYQRGIREGAALA